MLVVMGNQVSPMAIMGTGMVARDVLEATMEGLEARMGVTMALRVTDPVSLLAASFMAASHLVQEGRATPQREPMDFIRTRALRWRVAPPMGMQNFRRAFLAEVARAAVAMTETMRRVRVAEGVE